MKDQFTKGEFRISNSNGIIYLRDQEGRYLATIHTLEDGKENGLRRIEAEANGNLLAAAPDLLKALTNVRDSLILLANQSDLTKAQAGEIYGILLANDNAVNNAIAKANP